MKVSIDKLRWALAGGSLLLLVVLVGFVGYGRYRAAMSWKNHVQRLVHQAQQITEGFTRSRSYKGKTLYKLHAGKAIPHGLDQWTLQDVDFTFYGHGDGNVDHISGAQFEWDNKQEIAHAVGDVQMDVTLPASAGKFKGSTPSQPSPARPEDAGSRTVHIHTKNLVFVQKLGVGATDQQVEFHYAGMDCTSKGAEFNTNENTVHLLANVEMHGNVHGKPMKLDASKADLDRDTDFITLLNPVVTSGIQTVRSANALVHLRQDGSVETLQATENVVLEKGTRRINAQRMDASFNADNLPQHAKLSGGVTMDDSDPTRPAHGTASDVDGTFNAVGALLKVVATGKVQLQNSRRNAAGKMFSRSMQGNHLEATFEPEKKRASNLKEVHVTGAAQANAESPVVQGGIKKTQIAADDIRASFLPGEHRSPEVQRVFGEGHSRLEQDAPKGAHQVSTGDKVDLAFDPPSGEDKTPQVRSAKQTGGVHIQSRAAAKPDAPPPDTAFATADSSFYEGSTEKLTLNGNVHFTQGDKSVSAAKLIADQRTGDSDATGIVQTTFIDTKHHGDVSHISSDTAHLQQASKTAEFHGSDAHPVRLWHSASQVEAASLVLDGKQNTLAARPERPNGLVHAFFSNEKANASHQAKTPTSTNVNQTIHVTRITANTMDYDDSTSAATFGGNVHIDGATGSVQAKHAVAFLTKAETPATGEKTQSSSEIAASSFGGSLQKVVIWDDVRLQKPGRSGRGDRLVYTAEDESFILTGSPGHLPQIVDAERGNVTGAALMFRNDDNAIIVSGAAPGASVDERGHVHIGPGVKQ